jgi:DNA-binding XRE family transcriptional regulator
MSELRTQRGYSIRQLAEICELSKSTIVNMEKGRFSPRFEIVDKIAAKLGAEIRIAQ